MAILGCIADDFTGAGDIASFLVRGGMRTLLYSGVPTSNLHADKDDVDAVVIALKTRTQETKDAVSISLDAVRWLEKTGCSHYYLKYCSTFDSTPKGNIGPICDAVMEYLQVGFTLLCPALPLNGRTVKTGNLYVNGVPLNKSSMKNHPLTPMWDSDIANLMKPQSRYSCYKIGRNLNWQIKKDDSPFYLIPDCENGEDIKRIIQYFGDKKLLTGGSGIAEELAGHFIRKYECNVEENVIEVKAEGTTLLLAGSCSEATRSQIADFQNKGGYSIKVTPEEVIDKEWDILKLWEQIQKNLGKKDVLVYTSDSPERVREAQNSCEKVSEKLEAAMADIAELAVTHGIKKIIVAGGETSGAITKKLQFKSFLIGESVAPGVPVMVPQNNQDIRLILKSGNFGQKDFFARAITLMKYEMDEIK